MCSRDNHYSDNENNSTYNGYSGGYHRPEMAVETEQLYIGRISSTYTEAAVKNWIAESGPCEHVNVYLKGENKFAFVTYKSVDEAKQRLALMKNNIHGYTVRFARPKGERNNFNKERIYDTPRFENGEVVENPNKEDLAFVGARKATFEFDKSDMKRPRNLEFRKQADVDYGNGRNNLNNVNNSSSKYSNQSPPRSQTHSFTNRNQPKVMKEEGTVVFVEDDKMYVQINSECIMDFMTRLNSEPLEEVKNITAGSLYACLFDSEGQEDWYRARVINTNPLEVFYVDYGNSEIVEKSKIKRLPFGLDSPDLAVCVKNYGTHNIEDKVMIEKEESDNCWYVSEYAPWNCEGTSNKNNSFEDRGSQNTNPTEWNIKETGRRQFDDNRLRNTEPKEKENRENRYRKSNDYRPSRNNESNENENKENEYRKHNDYRSRNNELNGNENKESGYRKHNDYRSRNNESKENENRETRYRKSNDYRSSQSNESNENEYQKFNKHSPKQQYTNRAQNQESNRSGYETDGRTEVNINRESHSKNVVNSVERNPVSANNSSDGIVISEALLVGITNSEVYVVIDTDELSKMTKWFETCHRNCRPLRSATVDTICGIYSDDKWCRCRVICEKPLTVTLMDYGGIKEVDLSDLREIRVKNIASIKELAIKINVSSVHNYELNSMVKIERKADEDCWYLSKFAPWNKKKEEENYLNNIAFGDWIKITSCTQNGGFYIKGTSEEITEQYDSMMQSIAFECIYSKPDVTTMKDIFKGQIVAVRNPCDTNYHRAKILTISELTCFVLLVDTGDLTEETIEEIKLLSEDVQKIPYFAVKVNLKNVSKLPLTEEAESFINNCIARETKFKLTYVDNNTVDLIGSDNQRLSDLLPQLNTRDWESKLDNEDSDPTVSEIKFADWPVDVVIEVVVSMVTKDKTIMAGRVDVFYELESLDNLMAAYCRQNTNSFVPQQNELCLVKNASDGKFYRAYCVEKSRGAPFLVCFLDSGCMKSISHTEIRKMPREFLRFPVQICTGIVKNDFDVSNLERKRIKCKVLEMLEPGVYEIEIKNVVRS